MPDHLWELVDAHQIREDDDVLKLDWQCLVCSQEWGTYSGVTMPNWEAGDCEAPDVNA